MVKPTEAPANYDAATLMELGRLALKVAGNPETRRPFLKAVQKLEPDRRFPDQDIQDLREELEQKNETARIESDRQATEQRLGAQRRKLVESGKFTEDQVKEIETKVMPQYGIADYDAAAIIYGSTMAPARPANGQPKNNGVWELPTFEGLLEDPTKAARAMAYKAIDEINASKR